MNHMDLQTANQYRFGFKRFNPFMIWLWRLGFRRYVNCWPRPGGRVMVINHIGRKSGARYRTPLNYTFVDGEIYCMAGFGYQADWYRNILVHPEVEVWLPDSWWSGLAEDTSQDARRLPLFRRLILDTGLVGPIFGIDARKMSDEDFDRALAGSRLVRIRRTQRLAGCGGPGDLAWVWFPVLALLALVYGIARFRR
jgi:deazaflavin-dependent oxidoreductase (nitroreductase family)